MKGVAVAELETHAASGAMITVAKCRPEFAGLGAVDDGGLGTISADSQWIWSQDKDAHNDVFCRFTVPCGAEVLFSEDFQDSDAIGRWKGKGGAATPWSATIKSNGLGGQALMMNQCASGGDAYSDATVQCSIDTPCLVSYWSVGAPWQGFAEQFAGPHIWSATPTDYDGQHVTTPTSSDWQFTQYVFPGQGIDATNPAGDDETVFVHGGGEIGANPVRLMLESFSRTGECDTTGFGKRQRDFLDFERLAIFVLTIIVVCDVG